MHMQPPCKHMYLHAHTYAVMRACECAHGALHVCIYAWRCAQHLVTQLHMQTNIWTNMCTSKPTSAHIHVCTHTYVHAHTYTQSHTCKQPHACTRSCVRAHGCTYNMHSHPAALANMCTNTCMNAHAAPLHTYTHAHVYVHTRMQSCTHADIHVELCTCAYTRGDVCNSCSHMAAHANICMDEHVCVQTHLCTHTCAHTCMQSHRHANTPIFALVALHTHTHMHPPPPQLGCSTHGCPPAPCRGW